MSTATTTTASAKQLSRRRRRASWARGWRQFRASRSGMAGLVVLSLFVLIALCAPLLADADGLEVTQATGGVLESPSSEYWLGTDDNGRSVLTMLIWGARISLFVGLMATLISMVIGTVIGLTSGYFGGWPGAILFRFTEWMLVIPFLPLAIILATVLGRVPAQHRDRDRRDVVAGHGAADPQPRRCRSSSGRTSNAPRRLAAATLT